MRRRKKGKEKEKENKKERVIGVCVSHYNEEI